MKKPIVTLCLIALCSFALDMATFWLRGIDMYYCSLAAFPCYFLFVWLICRHWKRIAPAKILLATFLGWCWPYILVMLFPDPLHPAAQIDLAMHVLGMAAGYLFFKAGRTGKIAVATVSVLLLALEPTAIAAAQRYASFGSLDGRLAHEAVESIPATRLDGEAVVLGDDPTKIYVLDCWSSGCGNCIRQFPGFQRLYEKYRTDDRIVFCALNVGDTPEEAARILAEEGSDYDFPVAVCNRAVRRRLGFERVPTYLLITDNAIVYRNGKDLLEKRLKELLRRE